MGVSGDSDTERGSDGPAAPATAGDLALLRAPWPELAIVASPSPSPSPSPERPADAASLAGGPLPPRRIALFGLSAETGESVGMLAELLGWEVISFPPGPMMCPPARLCLATLPSSAQETSQLVAWSPNTNLNEHISRCGLSIMDQPPCIAIMETMLLSLSVDP